MTGSQDRRDGQRPKVSVCVVTYNQRDYIGQCLESIVTQRTDFPFEVIVGDDASTDGTTDIVRDYAERYPNLIRPVFHEKNVGPFENYRVVHRMARGEYVAHIDGDDAMLPEKLVKQVALLDMNPALSVVFHQLKMITPDGRDSGRRWPLRAPEMFNVEFLLKYHPIVGHSSMMYKNGIIDPLIEDNSDFVDFKVFISAALNGDVGYINVCYGEYRVGVGVSKGSYRWIPYVLDAINFAEKSGIDKSTINRARAKQLFEAAHNALFLKMDNIFKTHIEDSIFYCKYSKIQIVLFYLRGHAGFLRFLHKAFVYIRSKNIIRYDKLYVK